MKQTIIIFSLVASNLATLFWGFYLPSKKSLEYRQVIDLVKTKNDALSVFAPPIRAYRKGQQECLAFRERRGLLLTMCFDQGSNVVEYRFTAEH